VKARLQRRARRNGRSMEEEVRDILRAAVNKEEIAPIGGLGTELAALFPKSGPDFKIEELHIEIKPPNFEE
jgi:plasmid stability protein